ncbi:pyruvate ferredoxin oxidoreductase [Candidatus Bathyarchaeota archaeon]|nr:pyruvate ferredoxin oxidoreductase [Candidatus Bathyarchaeota archaeon]
MVDYEVMVGNKACAVACKLARVNVAAAFPITPQTSITEYLSELYASGEMPGFEFVNCEGELPAQVIVNNAALVGARAFTCTAGPGLQYMHHPMASTAGGRCPLVMAVVHRGIKSMQPDHSDLMSQQWTGWIHLYVENAQEILDTIIMGYKIGEDARVRLPVAVGYDGYVLSYTAEPVEIPPQEMVDKFLPPYKPPRSLIYDDPEASIGRGGGFRSGDPNYAWMMHNEGALNAEEVIKEVFAEWAKLTGRKYGTGMVEEYKTEGADVVITAMGTVAGSAAAAIDKLWKDGKKVGLVKIRSFLPFPRADFQRIAKNVQAIGVFDRSLQPGMGGPSYREIKNTLYDSNVHPVVAGFVGGLSGKEVTVKNFVDLGEKTLEYAKAKKADAHPIWV